MRGIAVLALSMLAFVGCGGCAASSGKPPEVPTAPDTSKVLKLIGRFSIASGCPVAPNRAYTAAHVVDPKPFDKSASYTSGVFQQGGRGGLYKVFSLPGVGADVSWEVDVAVIESEAGWEFYNVASSAPEPGATLWISGFDWRSKRNAFADRLWKVRLLRVVAGHLIFDPSGEPGTSGSCILNEEGLVVGINTGGKFVGSSAGLSLLGAQEEVGIGVLIVARKAEGSN